MAILVNGYEGTDGAQITVANSGGASGDAFTALNATVFFTTDQKMHGASAAEAIGDNLAAGSRWAITDATKIAMRIYAYIGGTQGGDLDFLRASVSPDTGGVILRSTATKQLRIHSSTGGAALWTGTATLPDTQWLRFELYCDTGTSATTGTVRGAVYAGDSTTPLDDSGVITGVNTGAGVVYTQARLGRPNPNTYSGLFYFDSAEVRTDADASSSLIGPVLPAAERIMIGGSWVPCRIRLL